MEEKKGIFIAEAQAILRDGLWAMLISHPDYGIIGKVEDGRKAIRGVEHGKPDLVILDLSMPEAIQPRLFVRFTTRFGSVPLRGECSRPLILKVV
jgi:DNA-binding NarL/FixJ family response regulator